MGKRRYRRRNEGATLVVGAAILVAFFFKNSNIGKIIYTFFLISVTGAILAGIYCFFRKGKPVPVSAPGWTPAQRPKATNTPQGINAVLASGSMYKAKVSLPAQVEPCSEWSLKILRSLEWKRFETVCSEYQRMIGYIPRETRIGADGGVDVWVYKEGSERPFGIIQCKAWTTYKVGVKPVRELYGVMAAEGIARGMFITSGEFTREALEFAEGKRLRLISGAAFLEAIIKLPAERQHELLEAALEGDYWTPTCPQCGSKMRLRKGRGSGREFWGCPRYPRCRATLVYKPDAA